MKTRDDPTGTRVLGMLNNCGGGTTPWGTVLTAEENFNQYFANQEVVADPVLKTSHRRYGVPAKESERLWERFEPRFDLAQEPERVHVVGIAAAPPPPRSDEGKDWARPRLLFVGQDWERKNGEAVLRAFRRLRQTVTGAELHLVGGHPLVEDRGVVGHGPLRLDRPGERARLWELFGSATCFVMPSHVEPSAIAYLEAASCGVASIGTRVGGSAELIGEGGVVVDPDDDAELLDAMVRLCDPATAAGLGMLAQRRSRRHTWPAVAARILTALGVPGFHEPALPPPSALGPR